MVKPVGFKVFRLQEVEKSQVNRLKNPPPLPKVEGRYSTEEPQYGEGKSSSSSSPPMDSVKQSLSEIKDGIQQLVELNSTSMGPNHREAQKYLKELDTISKDTTLPLYTRNRLYKEAHDQYLLYKDKAEEDDIRAQTEEVAPLPKAFTGERQQISEIIDRFSGNNYDKAGNILGALTSSGKLAWNEDGELVDQGRNTAIPETNISEIIRYDLASNKKLMTKPPGYALYKKAKLQSQDEIAEIATMKRKAQEAVKTPMTLRGIARVQKGKKQKGRGKKSLAAIIRDFF